MDFLSVATVTSIGLICYIIGELCKAFPKFPERFIPIIVGVLGGCLGVVGMYVIPDFPAANIFDAIAVGIASGLASTGANQIYKQLNKEE